MLRFAQRPDAIFLGILHDSLEDLQEILTDADEGFWPAQYPTAARCFSPDLARATLDQLLTASQAKQLYQLTDYHWLLLYDCLRVYCEIHNDYAQEVPSKTLPLGPYQIGRIDFDAVVDQYFWDTDFLLEGPTLAGLGPEGRKSMGVADETFGIAQGLPPHPDELMLTLWAEPGWEEAGEEGEAVGLVIPEYPPAEKGGLPGQDPLLPTRHRGFGSRAGYVGWWQPRWASRFRGWRSLGGKAGIGQHFNWWRPL
jgi:hypothetical protein